MISNNKLKHTIGVARECRRLAREKGFFEIGKVADTRMAATTRAISAEGRVRSVMEDDIFEDDKVNKQRCEGCEFKRLVHASGGFSFNGCYCRPYTGKWVATIEKCPKGELDNNVPEWLLKMRLVDMRCKHVFHLSKRAKSVLEESNKIGYRWCLWGSHSGNLNETYHIGKIRKQEADDYFHAVRIVLCRYPFSHGWAIWADNLHSTVRYIRLYGDAVTLEDIPFYVVIVDGGIPRILSHNGSVRAKEVDIRGAVECGNKRYNRSNSKPLIDLHYTIQEFLKDNKFLLDD